MSLLAGLTLRIVAVALACLVAAALWVLADTNRLVATETAATAGRVARTLERISMLGSSGLTPGSGYSRPLATRQAVAVVSAMAPGQCVVFTVRDEPERRVCSGWNEFGPTAPAWFRAAFATVFDAGAPVERAVPVHNGTPGRVVATADRVAVTARAWHQMRVVAGMAAAMAAGMAVLAALVVGHALSPLGTIAAGLRRLEHGDYAARLPAFRTRKFARIAAAVNDLATRLQRTTAERAALTRRLFQVQEEERRALARDLHDEFGQCLTAAGALAASIQVGAPAGRRDLADEARAIGRITAQMMATLKGALARLRPPDLDEVGLEASLRAMVGGWNLGGGTVGGGPSGGSRTTFDLDVADDLGAVPPRAALSVYRIAQECLTNAVRHGRPRRVSVSVARSRRWFAPSGRSRRPPIGGPRRAGVRRFEGRAGGSDEAGGCGRAQSSGGGGRSHKPQRRGRRRGGSLAGSPSRWRWRRCWGSVGRRGRTRRARGRPGRRFGPADMRCCSATRWRRGRAIRPTSC
jgi:HAMP domain-containing protein